jgi:hypothetical protein
LFKVLYSSSGPCFTRSLNEVDVVRRRERGRQDWNSEEVRKVEMNSRHSLEREYDTLKSMGLGAGDGGEEGGVEGGVGRVIDTGS